MYYYVAWSTGEAKTRAKNRFGAYNIVRFDLGVNDVEFDKFDDCIIERITKDTFNEIEAVEIKEVG